MHLLYSDMVECVLICKAWYIIDYMQTFMCSCEMLNGIIYWLTWNFD